MADGAWIRSARTSKGWTQAALGQKVGVNQVRVSLWERDEATPSAEQRRALEAVFGGAEPAPASTTESVKATDAGTPKERGTRKTAVKKADKGSPLGYEAQLWQMADALRGSMDAAEYKHVVLGLIFLKYISDAFEEHHERLEAERDQGAEPEDPDEYRALNVFWVPPEARWANLKAHAKLPTIGQLVDEAMVSVERDNPALKGVLPKDYARPALDKQRLGQLIDLISNIRVGDRESRAKDLLGRVYEYFLSQFASAEGKKGGEFYTPRCVDNILVEMIEPYKGRVYDPCNGSGGLFVQWARALTGTDPFVITKN